MNIGFVYGEYYEKRKIGAGRKNNKKMRTKIVIIWTKILKESTAFSVVVFSLRVIHFLICISGFNFVIWHVQQIIQLAKSRVYIKISRAALGQLTFSSPVGKHLTVEKIGH